MKATLNSEAIKIAKVVGPEEGRPVIMSVKIGNGEIIASNGFSLARRAIPTEPKTGEEVLINAKELLELKNQWKASTLHIETDGNRAVITDEKGNTEELWLVEGTYPLINQLYPTGERQVFIALSATELRRILSAVGKRQEIKFRIRGRTQPVEFIAGETRGLIIPTYSTEKDKLWHEETKKQAEDKK